jgi:hypothetical protein
MRNAQSPQDPFAVRRDAQRRLSPFVHGCSTFDEVAFDGALDELDGAMVLDLQPLRHGSDGWFLGGPKRRQNKQQLMLLRFNLRRARLRFAEVQEAADLVTKFGEGNELAGLNDACASHRIYRLTIYWTGARR